MATLRNYIIKGKLFVWMSEKEVLLKLYVAYCNFIQIALFYVISDKNLESTYTAKIIYINNKIWKNENKTT